MYRHFCQVTNAEMPLTTAVSRDTIVVAANSAVDFGIGNADNYCKSVTIVVRCKHWRIAKINPDSFSEAT